MRLIEVGDGFETRPQISRNFNRYRYS